MDLQEYFENAEGHGALATADSQGHVDVAVYARPHIMEYQTIAFIMPDRLTHHQHLDTFIVDAIKSSVQNFISPGWGWQETCCCSSHHGTILLFCSSLGRILDQ